MGGFLAFVSFVALGWAVLGFFVPHRVGLTHRAQSWGLCVVSVIIAIIAVDLLTRITPAELRLRRSARLGLPARSTASASPVRPSRQAEILTRLARPARSERDRTLRRFRFVLPRIVLSCSDVTGEADAGSMITTVHRMLRDAGLEREDGGYIGVANTFHRMSSDVSTRMGGPVQCSELLAGYVVAREGGYSPEASRRGAVLNRVLR